MLAIIQINLNTQNVNILDNNNKLQHCQLSPINTQFFQWLMKKFSGIVFSILTNF